MSKTVKRETVERKSLERNPDLFKPLSLKGLPEGKAQFDAEGFKGKKK